ncbi:MAG: LemA family protein [Hellea sp.]|nr:LemA family protein [Hellea sp.]
MTWVLFVILVVFAALVIWIFNKLVAARQLVENGWSDIEVQLKRRADLIPRIIDTVKAYAKHEKNLFLEVTEKRNRALNADVMSDRAAAEAALKRPLSRLMAVAEDYPDLKANENFLDLQDELSDTENKIEYSRRFYNGAVREKNTLVQSFPVNLLAGIFGFGAREYFEMDEAVALPDTSFGD